MLVCLSAGGLRQIRLLPLDISMGSLVPRNCPVAVTPLLTFPGPPLPIPTCLPLPPLSVNEQAGLLQVW